MGIMGISGANNDGLAYKLNPSKKSSNVYENISAAATKVTDDNESEVLGLSMIKDENANVFYGMRAQYAKESTEENPIIQVTSNYGGETVSYNIDVKKVDPRNASSLEMFALCSYEDDINGSSNYTYGSFSTLKYYQSNANDNGYINAKYDFESIKSLKLDWMQMCTNMMKDYYNAGVYEQYKDGQNLMSMFQQFIKS